MRTWLHITDLKAAQNIAKDANLLAQLEGLYGHAEAARRRIVDADTLVRKFTYYLMVTY
jgi:histidinol dehydrogenase